MKKYKLVCFIRTEDEENLSMSLEDAEKEREQAEFLFPENIYKIEVID